MWLMGPHFYGQLGRGRSKIEITEGDSFTENEGFLGVSENEGFSILLFLLLFRWLVLEKIT